jgi:hypothetical protein
MHPPHSSSKAMAIWSSELNTPIQDVLPSLVSKNIISISEKEDDVGLQFNTVLQITDSNEDVLWRLYED